jgi:hypothetical protein
MNFDQIAGPIFGIILLEYPLIILLWLLIRSGIVKIDRIRLLTFSEHGRKLDIIALIVLLIVIMVLFSLMIFPIILVIVLKLLSNLPFILRLFVLFGLLIIYVHIYALFLDFLEG